MHGRRVKLTWPRALKATAIRKNWFEKVSRLRAGLDLEEAVDLLNEPYGAVRRWAVLFGYKFPDRRRSVSTEQWDGVEWTQRDADIARDLGVTRECVRLVRKARGIGPSAPQAAIRMIEQYVAAHRERLHGQPVDEAIRQMSTDLPYHVVRRVLRDGGVRAHQPRSPLRDINWKLPNRDLAAIWGTSARYVANLRARLAVGPAKWNARGQDISRSTEYTAAVARERQKAQAVRRKKDRSGRPARLAIPA